MKETKKAKKERLEAIIELVQNAATAISFITEEERDELLEDEIFFPSPVELEQLAQELGERFIK